MTKFQISSFVILHSDFSIDDACFDFPPIVALSEVYDADDDCNT